MKKNQVSPRDIAEAIDMTDRNVRKTYKTNPNKAKFYRVLQLGTMCIMNGFTLDDLDAFAKMDRARGER